MRQAIMEAQAGSSMCPDACIFEIAQPSESNLGFLEFAGCDTI